MKYKVQEHQTGTQWKDAILVVSSKLWANCTFNSKREAEVYAYLWCNQSTKERAYEVAPEIAIGVPYEFITPLTFGEGVFMRIIEVVE